MSALYLIRHGQASFGAADYDVLTARGEAQSRALGRHLARALPTLDVVLTGPARRHRDTCRLALEAARAEGASVPEPTVLDGLDEFPGVELWNRTLPELETIDHELAALVRGGLPSDPRELERAAARATARLTDLWASGALDHHGLERFDDFDARVRGALDQLIAHCGRGVRVTAFTSAGPIAIAVRRALDLSIPHTLKIMRAVANASLSELRYREAELGLVSFNLALGP
jgi:broad specificity phosphatase PhoE